VQDFDLVVSGGLLATPSGLVQGDICIRQGRIVAILEPSQGRGAEVCRVDGKWILPGLIDSHVHFEMLQQNKFPTADDFATGTRAAAAGGITTVLDFASPASPEQTLVRALGERQDRAGRGVVVDYGLHMAPLAASDLSGEIDTLIEAGVTSFKLFQVYEGLALSDSELYERLEVIASRGAIATLHAENGPLVGLLSRRLRKTGVTAARFLAESRPPFVEAIGIETAIRINQAVGGMLYIVHLSTKAGLHAVAAAQGRGERVLTETCPQYLTRDEACLAQADGNLFICTPPLRPRENLLALWDGAALGQIQVGATDHCSFQREQKIKAQAFYDAPGGVGSIELLLPILYSEGVCRGRLDLGQLISLLAANPAAIFGLGPRKGNLLPGADADLVIFDPDVEWKVDARELHGASDYSIYQDMPLRGRVEATMSRGEWVFRNHEVLGRPGRGCYIPRRKSDLVSLDALLVRSRHLP
jgi:dihydropyrimidinase